MHMFPNSSGLPDYLVTFMENVRAGRLIAPQLPGAGYALPPDIPGMPRMPEPPTGLFQGAPIGGLFQPLSPVQPFDPTNQVVNYSTPQGQQGAPTG